MTRRKRAHVLGLVALLAVLFPAAVVALTTGGRPAPVGVGALGAAGSRLADIAEESGTVTSSSAPAAATPVTVPASTAATTTVVRRPTTTSPSPSVTRGPATTQPSAPPPTGPTTAVTTVPRPSSWSVSQNGIGLRMRMEPSAPQAGEPVTFFVELSPIDSCCIGGLKFGDGTGAPLAFEARCSYSQGAVQKAAATDTYAAAGAYLVEASVASVPCSVPSPAGDGSLTVMGFPVGVTLKACVVIGPATADCSR
jgi:hypothetical protein